MAPHSSTLAWKIPWTEEPGGLQSMGFRSQTRLKRLSSSSSRNEEECLLVMIGSELGVLACVSLLEAAILTLHWTEGWPHLLGRIEVLTGLSICPRSGMPQCPRGKACSP